MYKERNRKSIFLGLILFCVAIILCGVKLDSSAAHYKTIYRRFLTRPSCQITRTYQKNGQKKTYKKVIYKNYYKMIRLGSSKIPVLLVADMVEWRDIYVFTIQKGKVKYLGHIPKRGSFGYHPKYKALMVSNGKSKLAGGSLWTISKGKLKEIKSAKRRIYRGRTYYWKEGKRCTSRQFMIYKNKYFNEKDINHFSVSLNTYQRFDF